MEGRREDTAEEEEGEGPERPENIWSIIGRICCPKGVLRMSRGRSAEGGGRGRGQQERTGAGASRGEERKVNGLRMSSGIEFPFRNPSTSFVKELPASPPQSCRQSQ